MQYSKFKTESSAMIIDPESEIYGVLRSYNALMKEFVELNQRLRELKDHFDATFDIKVDGLDISPDPKRPHYIYEVDTFFKIYTKFKKRNNFLSNKIQNEARWININLNSGLIIEFLESEEGQAAFSQSERMLRMIDCDDFDPGILGAGTQRHVRTSTKVLDYAKMGFGDYTDE